MSGGPVQNTDRELWREREDDYYADSIHVTEGGGVGINHGGLVIVMPLAKWHALAVAAHDIKRGPMDMSNHPKQVFRVDAQGDTLYIDAPTRAAAKTVLTRHMGEIPESLLKWSGPIPLPDGEEAIA